MGSFELVPGIGETYNARLNLSGGIVKTYPLPLVKVSGISLHMSSPAASDSLYVTINATADVMGDTAKYSLVAQSGGKVCYAANLSFADGVIHGKINKERFQSGITRFTLFNGKQIPIAERAVFIDNNDGLHISLNTEKQTYRPKDSIALHIKVVDNNNQPVLGSFSLAVTDDSQIKADSSNAPNIYSYMLLTGDLKGDIEEPGYYFDAKNVDRYAALDNLLLTQGWVAYSWQDVFSSKFQPAFKAEPEIEVAGHISRVGGKSVAGLPVMLLSTNKPVLIRDTISDADGRFVFKHLPRMDTANFMLKVTDKKGKIFEANVTADEFTPALFTAQSIAPLKPWYVNSDTTLLNYMNQTRAYDTALDNMKYPAGTRHLKVVNINALKIIKGSHNLNGPGQADQVLDEEDMKKAGKMTLEDMLNNGLIKGFGMDWFPKGFPRKFGVAKILGDPLSGYHFTYQIYDYKMHLVIDGVDVHTFFQPVMPDSPETYEEKAFYTEYLKELTAEDIRGVEVLYSNRYNNKYAYKYLEPKEFDHTGHEYDPLNVEYAFLEITTWSGNGAYIKRTHGRYLYRPLPVSWPKQFYKPKYTAKSNNTLADLRSTIDWEPNIITNTAGEATVWFYARGKPSAYTIIVQGADLSGSVGVARANVKVK
jgi:hypothetical protein